MTKMYSYSKISTFEQCQLKFKFRYVDRIIPEVEKSIEAHLGSSVHESLEWLYTKVKENTVPILDELIIKYSDVWQKDFKEDFVIVNKQLTASDYFNKGIEFLVNYYMQNQPFNDNTIEVEKKIVISLDEEGKYKLQGYIDRLAYNLKSKEYEVHDYKTAGAMPQTEKLQKDRQLALYSIAIKEIYGENKRVRLIWHFLAHNKRFELKKTNEELEEIKTETLEVVKKIENARDYPFNKSILCDWCEYKNICPAWGNSPQNAPRKTKFSKEAKNEPKSNIDKYPTISKYLKD